MARTSASRLVELRGGVDGPQAPGLADRLRTPLTPAVGLVEVFLRRWEADLLPEQVRLLRAVEREGRRALGVLEAERDAASATPQVAAVSRAVTLEDAVISSVAGLLEAADDAALVDTLVTLVRTCGGEAGVEGRTPEDALRVLPDELRAPEGRLLTLGPVLRALCAAARERASGGLAPSRSGAPRPLRNGAGSGPTQDVLLSLDLGDVSEVRARLGDRGSQWLITKLQRTLRSLLQSDDRALRYPASRILILLRRTGPAQAQSLSDRLSMEWDSYLGRRGQVVARQVAVVDGDVAEALRALG